MSDFGSGFIVNIVKTMEHFSTTEFKEINKIYHEYNENTIRDITSKEKIEILNNVSNWVYGIHDHISEIKLPNNNEWEKIKWEEVKSYIENIVVKCVSIKNIYHMPLYGINIWLIIDEVCSIYNAMINIIVLIDKNLGIDSEWGKY